MEPSPAVTMRIEAEAQKLLRYFERITHCHAVIEAPHRHHRHGRLYSIHLELGVPGELLVIAHEPKTSKEGGRSSNHTEPQGAHKDIYVVVRDVFDAARRRLEDYARRVRNDVKHHEGASERSQAIQSGKQ